MNLTVHEASLYVHKLDQRLKSHRDVEIVLAPTVLALQTLNLQVDHRKFKLAAQNLYWRDEGAYTGEVSAHQLRGLVRYGIIGHSERRHIFREHEKDIRMKVQAAVRNHIAPVLCIGETLAERTEGETDAVIHDQIVSGFANLTAEEASDVVVAYEPVWAISGGKDFDSHPVPTPEIVKKVVRSIRRQLSHLYGKDIAESVRVLYGGSVNASNAAGFLLVHELDGFLIGGASLIEHEFEAIIKAAHERSR